jgi:hypothetical protein
MMQLPIQSDVLPPQQSHSSASRMQGTSKQVTAVNRNGMMYTPLGRGFAGEPLTLNLKQLTAGWHTLTVYGETKDTVTQGTQRGG